MKNRANIDNRKWTMEVARRAIFYFLFSSFAVPAGASFQDMPAGGRAAGVDGAMTALADDVFALSYNPAGTAFLLRPEAGTQIERLYAGLTDNSGITRSFFGYVHPFHHQAIGLSYSVLSLESLYKEETAGLSYAWKTGENLSWGVTGRYYRKSVGHDFNTDNAEWNGIAQRGVADPIFSGGRQADAWGGDASALYRLGHGWRTGLAVRNVNEPNVALGNGAADRAARSWNWGIARQWNSHAVTLEAERERFTLMETRLHGGMETWMLGGHVGLRAGGGWGDRDYRRVTGGCSYRMSILQLDYGFTIPLGTVEGTPGTQQLSLIVRFGTPPGKALLQPSYDQETMMDLNDILGDAVALTSGTAAAAVQPESGELTVSPSYVSLTPGQSQQFRTHVTGMPDGRVVWSLMPALGSLSQSGIYQAARAVLFPQDIWITAKSEAHPMHYERAVVHLKPPAEGPVTLKVNVAWDTGQSAIRPAHFPEIEKVAEIMRQYPQIRAVIKGYADDRGSAQANERLSEKRADAVRAQLVDHCGIDPNRVVSQPFSPSHPPAFDPTAADRRINRRVEIVLSAPTPPAMTMADSD